MRYLDELSPAARSRLRRLGGLALAANLGWLARWYGTDKAPGQHGYTTIYAKHLAGRRLARLSVLEIGVGGHETNTGGESLRMWRSYLPRATVVGVDLYPKDLPPEPRIIVLDGDQSDPVFLRELVAAHGPFDLIVDDGSHRGDHINASFEQLWPNLRPGGVYAIEDITTAYDPEYGGGPPGSPLTSMTPIVDLLHSVQGHGTRSDVAAVDVHHDIALVTKRTLSNP